MASAIQKITLSSARDIPFNKLVLSQSNVRRVKAGVSIEELAQSIARRGLIQSLHVRPVLDADGAETDNSELFAADFIAGELFLFFFHSLGKVFCILLTLQPFDSADDIS